MELLSGRCLNYYPGSVSITIRATSPLYTKTCRYICNINLICICVSCTYTYKEIYYVCFDLNEYDGVFTVSPAMPHSMFSFRYSRLNNQPTCGGAAICFRGGYSSWLFKTARPRGVGWFWTRPTLCLCLSGMRHCSRQAGLHAMFDKHADLCEVVP